MKLDLPPFTARRVTRYSKTTRHPRMHRAQTPRSITSPHNPQRDGSVLWSSRQRGLSVPPRPHTSETRPPQPIGKPRRDIMAILRAAADKVFLHAAGAHSTEPHRTGCRPGSREQENQEPGRGGSSSMYTKMETTFYDDSVNAFYAHDAAGFGYNSPKVLKRSMTLNLGDPSGAHKVLRARAGDLLTSPDVGLLKLASPELERLIIQSGNGLITTTPTPTHFVSPKNVTDEQEGFAEGFVRALAELHHQHTPGPAPSAPLPGGAPGPTVYTCSSSAAADSPVYEDLNSFHPALSTVSAPGYTASAPAISFPVAPPQLPVYGQAARLAALKEEPQTVPEMPGETPPLSPINMENQERIKAERKRMRNRVAASKCRKRKLERISRLEDKVKNLKSQNSELASTANTLREQVSQLKQKVMNHVNSGCQLMLTQQLQTF
ncbi:transcription factor Jun [Spinachia spinachia]